MYATYYTYPLASLTLPLSARETRYQSAVRIQKQPRIHLSWFTWIWDRWWETTAGRLVVFGEESKGHWSKRSAACYLVSLPISAYILATDGQFCNKRFCFVLNKARPLFPLETAFFETTRASKGFYHPCHLSSPRLTFYCTRYSDIDLDDDASHKATEEEVEKKFRKPLSGYAYPPCADVCFEGEY